MTGRLKEQIIIRGKNYYPIDIERTAQASHTALRSGSGAAFGVEAHDEERLVLVQELERSGLHADLEEVRRAMIRAIVEEHEVQPSDIVLVRPGAIPKTTSGKLQRLLCRNCWHRAGRTPGCGGSSSRDLAAGGLRGGRLRGYVLRHCVREDSVLRYMTRRAQTAALQ